MKRHSLSLAAITLLALASVQAAYAGGAETAYAKALSADAMYLGGAILIGLVAAGVIACAGFATGKMELNTLAGVGFYMMITGAILAVGAQGIAMLHAGGVYLTTPYEFTTATVGSALAIIVGFALVTTGRFVNSKRQSAKDKSD